MCVNKRDILRFWRFLSINKFELACKRDKYDIVTYLIHDTVALEEP